ncbi:MAG: FHA domain-containing protein, partial [Anaerolineae bacterium]|nr:FHA domain-containing protein [Anaerolineae bacterium]
MENQDDQPGLEHPDDQSRTEKNSKDQPSETGAKSIPPMPLTHILIVGEDDAGRTLPLKSLRFSIGRSSDNNIVLDHPDVSRHHARVEYNGRHYLVTDLNSTNGCYLGDTPLTPGVPTIWPVHETLHIAEFQLHLVTNQSPPQAADADTDLNHKAAGIVMPTNHFSAVPGHQVSAPLIIHNEGQAPDYFRVTLEGLPADWVLTPAPVFVLPGQKQEVRIILAPPHTSHSRAGRYTWLVRVSGQREPDKFAKVEGSLTIEAYHEFRSDLQPHRLKAGQVGQILVENRGNIPETYMIEWQAPAQRLAFEPAHTRLTVRAGEVGTKEFSASPQRSRWFGGAVTEPFVVQINATSGSFQTQEGELTHSGLLPAWLLLLLLIPLLGAIVLVGIFLTRPSAADPVPVIQNITLDPPTPVANQPVTIHWRLAQA